MVDCNDLHRRYWEDGQTLGQIGGYYGRSITTIRRWMEGCGISRRQGGHERKCPDCDVLLRLYHGEGWNLEEIAQEYECSAGIVGRNMERCDIERRACGRVPIEIGNLAEMYKAMSMREIAEVLGIETLTVSRAMDRAGIVRDTRHLYRCNPLPAFFGQDSAEMYYVLGLLFADGNISKRGQVTICQRKHPGVLHKISRFLGRAVSKNRQTLTLGGQALAKWLLGNFGVGPAKSNILQWPRLPGQFARDFVRGFFDGDGSIWLGRVSGKLIRNVSFTCGSRDFLLGLRSMLQTSGMSATQIYGVRSQTGHAYRLMYRGKARATWFYDYMYYPSCLCIGHKKDIFEEAI